jgi:hypothetical protein
MRSAKAFSESQMSGRIETGARKVVLSYGVYLGLVKGTTRQLAL